MKKKNKKKFTLKAQLFLHRINLQNGFVTVWKFANISPTIILQKFRQINFFTNTVWKST